MKKNRIFLSGLVLLIICAGFVFTSAASALETKTTPKKMVEKKEVIYVASKEGGKYHLPTCSMVTGIKPENKVTFKTKAEAEKAGYTPCAVCFKKK